MIIWYLGTQWDLSTLCIYMLWVKIGYLIWYGGLCTKQRLYISVVIQVYMYICWPITITIWHALNWWYKWRYIGIWCMIWFINIYPYHIQNIVGYITGILHTVMMYGIYINQYIYRDNATWYTPLYQQFSLSVLRCLYEYIYHRICIHFKASQAIYIYKGGRFFFTGDSSGNTSKIVLVYCIYSISRYTLLL